MIGEYAINEIIIEGLDASIRRSMREYLRGKKEENIHDLAFHATSFPRLQGQDLASKRTNPAATRPQTNFGKPWTSHRSGVNDVRTNSIFRASAATRRTLGTLVVPLNKTRQSTPPNAISFLIESLDVLPTMNSASYCRVC